MKKITLTNTNVSTSSATVEAFQAFHKNLGTGTLYRYLSRNKEALVARFFPKDWSQGCVYISAKRCINPNLPNKDLAKLMDLDHILGEVDLPQNFRITTATQLWLQEDMEYDKGVLTFVLKRFSETYKFTLTLALAEDDENLLENITDSIHQWVWKKFPGCSLQIQG